MMTATCTTGQVQYLVEASCLSVPLLDTVESRLAREIEHEQDRNCVIADQRQHVDKLPLT